MNSRFLDEEKDLIDSNMAVQKFFSLFSFLVCVYMCACAHTSVYVCVCVHAHLCMGSYACMCMHMRKTTSDIVPQVPFTLIFLFKLGQGSSVPAWTSPSKLG